MEDFDNRTWVDSKISLASLNPFLLISISFYNKAKKACTERLSTFKTIVEDKDMISRMSN